MLEELGRWLREWLLAQLSELTLQLNALTCSVSLSSNGVQVFSSVHVPSCTTSRVAGEIENTVKPCSWWRSLQNSPVRRTKGALPIERTTAF